MSTKLADLAVGDTITVKHTVKVEKIGTGSVQVRSEDGSLYGYDDESARFKLVEKALPKVGDAVDATTLRETKWRRGTVLAGWGGVHTLTLTGKGEWFRPSYYSWDDDATLTFDQMVHDLHAGAGRAYTVVRLP